MLDTEQLDIVSVCTYTVDPTGHDLHTEISLYCIEKGIKAVWCEKPVVASMDGGDAMLSAAKASGTLLTINHNRRWENSMRKLQAAVKAGELGQLVSAEVVWPSGRAGVVGTHFIDAMLMATGQRAVAVSGMIDETPFADCRNNADNADFVAIQGETNVDDPVSVVIMISTFCLSALLLFFSSPRSCVPPMLMARYRLLLVTSQGCYGTLKMDGGMVVTVCAGNNLSGGAAIRLYGSQGNAVIGVRDLWRHSRLPVALSLRWPAGLFKR